MFSNLRKQPVRSTSILGPESRILTKRDNQSAPHCGRSPESAKSIPRHPDTSFRAQQLLNAQRGSSSTESIPELMSVRRTVSEPAAELLQMAHPVSMSQLSGCAPVAPSPACACACQYVATVNLGTVRRSVFFSSTKHNLCVWACLQSGSARLQAIAAASCGAARGIGTRF